MAPQNADKHCFRGQQNGHCIQQVTGLPGDFPHVFTDKVPELLARKSRAPLGSRGLGCLFLISLNSRDV